MFSEIESKSKIDIYELDLKTAWKNAPRPFTLHPSYAEGFVNALFYCLLAFAGVWLIAFSDPPWVFMMSLAVTVLYGTWMMNLWRKDPRHKLCLPEWVGKWSMRVVIFLLLPSVFIAGSFLVLIYSALFSGQYFFWTLPGWLNAQTLLKQLSECVSVISFLGINVVKASPVLTDKEWKNLSLAEHWLALFLSLICFLELIITVA